MNSTLHLGAAADLSQLSHTVARRKIHLLVRAFIGFAIVVAAHAYLNAQAVGILCTDGEGTFTAKSMTGVIVTVGASKTGGFASRSCGATLSYREKTIHVVEDASQVDIDVMDVDLDRSEPIIGIQYKEQGTDRLMTYAIYHLDRTLQLLRTIRGGDFFRAADFHLDQHIEISTGDAAAIEGFEGIPFSSFDSAPMVYLRLESGKLIDVSSEFGPEYDSTIAELKASLDPASLKAFKLTNGKLDSIFLRPADEQHMLMETKIKALEIVWNYLYSGRETEAWSTLKEMWPADDVDRIHAAILEAQQRSIRRQVDGVSTTEPRSKIKHVHFYDTDMVFKDGADDSGHAGSGNLALELPATASSEDATKRAWTADIDPVPIYMHARCLADNCLFQQSADILLDLRLDDAGKVIAAKPMNDKMKGPGIDIMLKSALTWKFIPAYKNGHPVACTIQQIISPSR